MCELANVLMQHFEVIFPGSERLSETQCIHCAKLQ